MPASIAVLDADGAIILVNRPWREFGSQNGLTMRDAGVGTNYLDICAEAATPNDPVPRRVSDAIKDTLAGRDPEDAIEYPCHSPDKRRWFIFRCTGFVVNGEHYALVTHTDITARRLVEEELRESREATEAFNLAVSHDLRAPLRRIEEVITLIEEEPGPPPRDLLERIHDEATRARALATDLLDLSRFATGDQPRSRLDLTAIANDIVHGLRTAEPDRKVTIHIDEDMTDEADPRSVRVLLGNLITNAWKYTSATPDARIDIGRAPQPNAPAHYYVRDNGIGFDPARADRLFLPFQRLDSARAYEGTGVGLTLVRRAAESHGGRAWAQGRPGQGATFWFTLHAVPG